MKKTLLILCVLLSGCAGYVQTSSTSFHGQQHSDRGTIRVQALDATQKDSLEFNAVSEYVQKKLIDKGFVSNANNPNTEYIAFITYGIDTGSTSTSTVPIFGQTGGGTSYSTGVVNTGRTTGTFSSTTTTMPTYGMIGAIPVNRREYRREVNINIWRYQNPPAKVYELKGVSSGSCSNINSVIRPIIDAMFENFPGENGKTRNINVTWDGNC